MSAEIYKFMAADAISYVDTYRRLIMNTPGDISISRDSLDERMQEMNVVPPRLYAELRAHEHALDFVLKQQEPGMVALGELPAPPSEEEQAERRDKLERLENEQRACKQKLKQLTQQRQEMEAELVERRQEVEGLKRKISQTYDTVAVSGVATVIILLALLASLFVRVG